MVEFNSTNIVCSVCKSLINAAHKGHVDCLKKFLETREGPNVQDRSTALMCASWIGREDIVKILLVDGTNPDLQMSGGYEPPLVNAASQGHVGCVNIFLEAGANPNTRGVSGRTALMAAAGNGRRDCVKILLKAGTERNLQTIYGGTALMSAAEDGDSECMILLLDAGENPNLRATDGWTALMSSSWYRRVNCMKLLLHAGADDTVQDAYGNTALTLAIEHGYEECVQVLKEWNDISHS